MLKNNSGKEMNFESDIIIVDTETTGLLKPIPTKIEKQPFATEIYAVRLSPDFKFVSEIDTLIKPPIPISEEITKITGISDETVKDAPSFFQIYDELYDLFEGCRYVVGQNIEFDIGILDYELSRHNFERKFPWPKHHICTIESSYHYKNKRLKLSDLHELLLGKGFAGAHRAKTDVMATVRCFIELYKRGEIKI